MQVKGHSIKVGIFEDADSRLCDRLPLPAHNRSQVCNFSCISYFYYILLCLPFYCSVTTIKDLPHGKILSDMVDLEAIYIALLPVLCNKESETNEPWLKISGNLVL